MARVDQTEILTRMVVDNPVPSVLHSVQSKEGHPLDPKCSAGGNSNDQYTHGNQTQAAEPLGDAAANVIGDVCP